MNKTIQNLRVIKNEQLNHDTYRIVVQSPKPLGKIVPGQFVNVYVPDSATTFLRRPLSIHDVDIKEDTFSLLVKAVGDGTRKMVQSKPNEEINIVYPLGNGFSEPKNDEHILLVGGGVGIAPMLHLAREARENGSHVEILLGARSVKDHVLLDEFKLLGNLHLTTNDGTLGTQGFVTDHAIFNSSFNRIYCCGPEPMMLAVARKAKMLGIECEVSLENMMACGFGVCLCCVTKTNEGNKCVCTEGPVFNINDLQWPI
jgi:dihydroorotate dehydrogenase electron transfer subunit